MLTRVGVFVNLEKDAARDALGRFTRWLRAKGVEPMLLDTQADALGEPGAVGADTFFAKPDLIVSLGGDGTFLHVARHIHGPTPPLLGVNFGHLGYLTAVEASDLVPFFERVLTDEVPVEHRLRLGCEVPGWRDSPPALNDIVIQDAAGIRTLRLRVRIGDRTVGVFAADGIIAATPTGSTAYTLSVGGPVVHPGVEAMLFTLISAHTLSARPMVVSPSDPLTIEALEDRPVRVTIDGQEVRELPGSAPIRIHRHPRDIAVVVDPERAFIDRLREKLSWGGTNHNL